jgi:pyruvate ferredoxin oxidoreductase gamma subunit
MSLDSVVAAIREKFNGKLAEANIAAAAEAYGIVKARMKEAAHAQAM